MVNKEFFFKNITTGELLIDREPLIDNLYSSVLVDGFRLELMNINNPSLTIDSAKSGWSRDGIMDFLFTSYTGYSDFEEVLIGDFEIRFGETGVDTSQEFNRRSSEASIPVLLPSIPVNFTIIDKNTNQKVPFAFRPYTGKTTDVGDSGLGNFIFRLRGRRTDEIIFLKQRSEEPNELIASWQVSYDVKPGATDTLRASPGDVLNITNLSSPLIFMNLLCRIFLLRLMKIIRCPKSLLYPKIIQIHLIQQHISNLVFRKPVLCP
jgi:5-hydroxyisourate hydrolase-like protein (transthyretin family)